MLRVGSLFTGIGGFDLAFEREGFETAWQCEIDKHATAVLEQHWPGLLRIEDVRWLSGALVPPVDVITFGSPCQDLSVAGKRAGLGGERSGLFFEAMRVIREMREATDGRCPTFIVWENVPGALSSNHGLDFAAVLDEVAELGALDICWRVLDAQNFGVPQRRRRIFLVADFRGCRAGEILFQREGCVGNAATVGEGWVGSAEALASSIGGDGDVVGALDTECGGGKLTLQSLRSGHFIPMKDGMYWDDGQCADTSNVSALVKRQTMPDKRRLAGVLVTDGPRLRLRRLTPTECERLQGFPDGWTDNGQADSHRYRQLGNAVAVPVAQWVARLICEASGK